MMAELSKSLDRTRAGDGLSHFRHRRSPASLSSFGGSTSMSSKHPDGPAAEKEALLKDLAERLVRMGWFVAGSEGLEGTINLFRQAPDDQLKGLIAACDCKIANPTRCQR